jgi:hypothetical protein
VQVFRPGPIEGQVSAFVTRREVGRDHARFDATLVDDDGRVLVQLEGVSTHRLPGEAAGRTWADA